MRRSPLLFGCLLAMVFAHVSHRVSADDDSPPDAVPQGEVMKFTFKNSEIFPGTIRDYWIYVPRQYDPAKPACVYVNQDGIQYDAPAVFDQLIHSGEMPVTIGVFVMHGRVESYSEDTALPRYNRSYEYDGLGDAYVRFLLEELLPDAETKQTSDGRPIRLSQDGNDRCIGGASSGAICAFTAAWERPHEFSRVFSAIGTYVGLRGGNDYPTWIRKFEPKPIRIFLQDGSADLNIYAGDWWMANQEMERALTFAGYEVEHIWGEGGHNLDHPTQVFPDAMRYLWKDWPGKVRSGLGSPQLQDILIPGEDWMLVSDAQAHGLTVNANGDVFFTDHGADGIYKIVLGGQLTKWLKETSVSGQAVGPAGRLYTTVVGDDKLVAYDEQANQSVIAEKFACNDVIVLHDGSLYATNAEGLTAQRRTILYINPTGEQRIVDDQMWEPSCLAVSPDQTLLYAADVDSHWIYSYQILPHGLLASKQKYYHLHVPDWADDSRPTGMQTDRDGRLYVATRMGIQVCDQAGRVNCIIPTPNGEAGDVCFGGADFDTLFTTSGSGVYKRRVKVKGANAFQAPLKPAAPRL